MRTITAADVTRLCEWGADKHDLDRAIALLRLASPGESAEGLAELPVGQRDARLMKLRTAQFGQQFDMRVECPKCQSPLEFGMNMKQLFGQAFVVAITLALLASVLLLPPIYTNLMKWERNRSARLA